MKVVCLCGSPKKDGNTSKILNEVVRALHESGAEVTQYFIGERNINYCTGCKLCEKDGECIQNDDVKTIIDDIYASQLVIVASPSYWGDITGQMKVFIDRCTPYCNENINRKPSPDNIKGIAIAIRAGQNKKENETLIHTFEHFLGHLNIPLISNFTAEGINTADDLKNKPEVLIKAYEFGKSICI